MIEQIKAPFSPSIHMKPKIDYLSLFILCTLYVISFYIFKNFYSLAPLFVIIGFFLLNLKNHIASFLFAFLFIIDPLNLYKFSGLLLIPYFLCFFNLILFKKSLSFLNEKKISLLFKVLIVFNIFQFLSFFMIDSADLNFIKLNINHFFGIYILLPAAYYTLKNHNQIFIYLSSVSLLTVLIYLFSQLNIINIIDFYEVNRTTIQEGPVRSLSFDLRNITKIFVYLSPSFLLFYSNKKIIYLVSIIGAITYFSVASALLRNEMLYLILGSLFAVYLNQKFYMKRKYFKLIFSSIIIFFLLIYFLPNLYSSILFTYNFTVDSYFNSRISDTSYDIRLYDQIPIIKKLFYESPFIGQGLFKNSFENTGHNLLFDVPVFASFSTYGIIGMTIYFLRFIVIHKIFRVIKKIKFKRTNDNSLLLLTFVSLYAFFITCITFKNFHIGVELAFWWAMPEFGLFMGIFVAIYYKIKYEKINS
tara:strand:+ start:2457 stop:3878 length:1422 start_codon:yes stop_codon:yes gene_type:complete